MLRVLHQSHRNKVRSPAVDYASARGVAASTRPGSTTAGPATHVAAARCTHDGRIDVVKVSLVLDVLNEKLHIADHGDNTTARLHRSVIDGNRNEGPALRYRLAICSEGITGSSRQGAGAVVAADRIYRITSIRVAALPPIRDEVAYCLVVRPYFEAIQSTELSTTGNLIRSALLDALRPSGRSLPTGAI